MVKGYHLQLRSCPLLLHTLKQLNIKAAAAHYPIIQQKVDELLAKGAIESPSGGAGFYSNVYVVPKHTDGLKLILNLLCFNCYMHTPTFKTHSIRHVWQLIEHGDYAFFIYLKDAYLHVPIVKHDNHHFFYNLCGKICHISEKFYFWCWPQSWGFH